jgi:hypothetical protein
MEISSHNPRAHRTPGGIWNEDELPVLEWEAAEHRVVLPESLQRALGIDTPVLRWAREKRDRVAQSHGQPNERRQAENLGFYLSMWTHAGPDRSRSATWHVFFEEDDRGTQVILGRDGNGSVNVVTLYSPSRPNALENRIARGNYVRRE